MSNDDKLIFAGGIAVVGSAGYGIYKGGRNIAKSLDRHYRIFGGSLTDDKAKESIKKALKAVEVLNDYSASEDPDPRKLQKLVEKVDERVEKMDRRVLRQVARLDKNIGRYEWTIGEITAHYDAMIGDLTAKRDEKCHKYFEKIAKVRDKQEELQNGRFHVHALFDPTLLGGSPDPQAVIAKTNYDEKRVAAWMDRTCAAQRTWNNGFLDHANARGFVGLDTNELVRIVWANAQMVETKNGKRTGTSFQKKCDGFWRWLCTDAWTKAHSGGHRHVWWSADKRIIIWDKSLKRPSDPDAWIRAACDTDELIIYNGGVWVLAAEGEARLVGWFQDDTLESAQALVDSLWASHGGKINPDVHAGALEVFAAEPTH